MLGLQGRTQHTAFGWLESLMTEHEVQRKRKEPFEDIIDVKSSPVRLPSRRCTAEIEVVDLSTSLQRETPSNSTTKYGSTPHQINRSPRNRPVLSEITAAVPLGTAGHLNLRLRGGTSELVPAPSRGTSGILSLRRALHAQRQGELEADELKDPSAGMGELFGRYNYRHF